VGASAYSWDASPCATPLEQSTSHARCPAVGALLMIIFNYSRRLAKRPQDRHSSSNSHPNTTSGNRKSRSHSPTHQKLPKRRNAMNSCDAACDEMEMMALPADSTAEAASAVAVQSPSPINGSVNGLADVDAQAPSSATAKKK
jgi:hypothetical protein